MSTRTEQMIAQKLKEIEQLRETQYEADIVAVLNKKHTTEELYAVADAFCKNLEKRQRQANLVKAREARKNPQAPAS